MWSRKTRKGLGHLSSTWACVCHLRHGFLLKVCTLQDMAVQESWPIWFHRLLKFCVLLGGLNVLHLPPPVHSMITKSHCLHFFCGDPPVQDNLSVREELCKKGLQATNEASGLDRHQRATGFWQKATRKDGPESGGSRGKCLN